MGGTTLSTPVSGSLLGTEKNEDEEEEEADGEDGGVDGKVLAPWASQVAGIFLLFVRGQVVELEAGRLAAGVCLSVPSWSFFSLSSKRAWRASMSTKRTTL